MAQIAEKQVIPETYHVAEWKKSGGDGYLSALLAPLKIRENSAVLDLGCGSGYVSAYLSRKGVRRNFGLELAPETLALARGLSKQHSERPIHWVCGRAEAIPIRTGSIDHLVCRAVLPYTVLPLAVAEISRIIADNGTLLLLLHPWTMYARKISLHPKKWKTSVALVMILLTGILFHFTGVLWRPRFGRWRIGETFQTLTRMRKVLKQNGFSIYGVNSNPEFIVYASKTPA